MSDEGGVRRPPGGVPLQNIPIGNRQAVVGPTICHEDQAALQELAKAIVEAEKKPVFELAVVTETAPKGPLFDHRGDPIFEGNVTTDDVKDAMRAASDAERYDQAEDIAKRYGLDDLCPRCAEPLDPPQLIVNPYAQSPFSPGGPNSWDSQIRAFQAQKSHEDSTKVNCHGRRVRLCPSCFNEVQDQELDFATVQMFKHGLISRNVQ